MLRVIDCIASDHDYGLVAVAAVVCVAGCWLALRLFSKARARSDASRLTLSFMAAVAAGASIWTTHFVAMVAYSPSVPHAYGVDLTLLSLFISVLTCWIGFSIALQKRFTYAMEIGGAVIGLGVASMHFTGMQAFLVAGRMHWDQTLVVVSVLFGTSFGALALNRLSHSKSILSQYGSAAALTLAVVLLHFTAMGAVTIIPDPTVFVPDKAISSGMLATASAGVAFLVLGTSFASYVNDNRAGRELRQRMEHLALTDALTGLPNRTAFNAELDSAVRIAAERNERLTILVFDLNRFKEINDVHGHAAGDAILSSIAGRLSGLRRPNEMIARVGGDEFVYLQRNSSRDDGAESMVARLAEVFREPVVFCGNDLKVGASIGAAVYPDDGESPDQLLSNADVAMYRAKKTGELIAFSRFDREMDELMRQKRTLLLDLGVALEKNHFEMHYQLQQDVSSGTTLGFEALIRWQHQERGLIPPAKFIPLAEESGLIIPLGEWALETACREAASWDEPLRIAVNLSPVQFKQSDLADTVLRILLRTGLQPSRLELEITESTLIEDFDRVLAILRRLKALGVGIAMDDFGTGYSSLSTLQAFPFDKIKIDKSFIQMVTTRHQAAAIVRAVLSLGRDLSIPVLAEGVETHEHLDFLARAGCDEVQGYLLGRPVPGHAIRHLFGLPQTAVCRVAVS